MDRGEAGGTDSYLFSGVSLMRSQVNNRWPPSGERWCEQGHLAVVGNLIDVNGLKRRQRLHYNRKRRPV